MLEEMRRLDVNLERILVIEEIRIQAVAHTR